VVASWNDLEAGAASVAKLGMLLLARHGKAYLATVTPAGAPRVHPVCPVVSQGKLLVGINTGSPKYRDLLRDGRFVLHALPGPADAEFWIEGVARDLPPEEAGALGARDPRLRVSATTQLFELRIGAARGTTYRADADGMPVPDRRAWYSERQREAAS
jgi:hypothetical protein